MKLNKAKKSLRVLREEGAASLFAKATRKAKMLFDKEFRAHFDVNSMTAPGYYDFSYKDLDANRILLDRDAQAKARNIHVVNWFIPHFTHPMGGMNTIFRLARFLRGQGVRNNFIIYSPVNSWEKKEVLFAFKKYLPDLLAGENIFYSFGAMNEVPDCDAAIATRWDSAYTVLKFNGTKSKFYFIQDFEPLFYKAGYNYALAEATYRFGFSGIINSFGLYEVYRQYGSPANYFNPAVDGTLYYPAIQNNKDHKRPIRIFFYGRPGADRNAFPLGIEALKLVKKQYDDAVEILSAGQDWDESKYGVKGIIKNIGLIKSLKEVAELYRNTDIGLAFVFTRHPSYQPLEFMASGAATVTNFNKDNLWLLKDGENALLSEPTPSCVAEKIGNLIDDEVLRKKIVANGLKTMAQFDWDKEMQRMWNFMKNSE